MELGSDLLRQYDVHSKHLDEVILKEEDDEWVDVKCSSHYLHSLMEVKLPPKVGPLLGWDSSVAAAVDSGDRFPIPYLSVICQLSLSPIINKYHFIFTKH